MKDLKEQSNLQAENKRAQIPGAVVQITTTIITSGADLPAVNVIPLKLKDDVGKMHSDVLSADNAAIPGAVPIGIDAKKFTGKRFDVSGIMKAFDTFTNNAKASVKEKPQEIPMKIRNNMINSSNSSKEIFHKRLKVFIDKEIHIKLPGDENAVSYVLREIEKEFLVVDYGESQRYIPINKIIFLQIGSYPKEER